MVQRWLLTGLPVDQAFTDEMLDTIVLPLLRLHRPRRPDPDYQPRVPGAPLNGPATSAVIQPP